mmetsp:Transcript_9736/g.18282  ORF Transcript_9736/g.18282 Transcript_9736/m.18282 type:complete len:196 (+) Transcript_9736:1153-1740(+)
MRNCGRHKNPILRCRRIIYECQEMKPFFFIYDDGILAEQLVHTGSCGEFVFCLYNTNKLKQKVLVGLWKLSLNFQGKIVGMSTFFECDGITPIENSLIEVEIGVLMPAQMISYLKEPSESEQSRSRSCSYKEVQVKNDTSVLSRPNLPKDICLSVADRHRKHFQRRFERRQSRILEENERIYRRLSSILMKPRRN